MHEPTTVELHNFNGSLYNFNVGVAILRSYGTVFHIGENELTVSTSDDLSSEQTTKVMQLFSDLLTDAGV